MIKPTLVAAGLLAGASLMASSAEAAGDGCEPQGDMRFLCGPANAEDLVAVEGTRWIIASGLAIEGAPARIHLIDSAAKSYEVLFPGEQPRFRQDKKRFGACPGPIDPTNFSAHGLAIRPQGRGVHRIYMTSHGAREAIEIFELDARGAKPQIAWVGCVLMPESSFTNSVSILPDGGFVATKMFDTSIPNGIGAAIAGRVSGHVYEWRPKTGLKALPNTELAGPNGIEVSADGKQMFVAAWGARKVVRYRLDGRTTQDGVVEFDFMTDNLRWAPNGKLLVTGHRMVPPEQCPPPCSAGWAVVEMDPQTLATRTLIDKDGEASFQNATVALRMGEEIWIGTYRGNRILYMQVP